MAKAKNDPSIPPAFLTSAEVKVAQAEDKEEAQRLWVERYTKVDPLTGMTTSETRTVTQEEHERNWNVSDTGWMPACPSCLSIKQYHDILRLARVGMNNKQIAAWVALSEEAFAMQLQRTPDLARAIDNARTHSVSRVANVCYERAMSGDMQAMKLFLQHVGKWNVQDMQQNTQVNVQVNNILKKVPIEDISKILRAANQEDAGDGE